MEMGIVLVHGYTGSSSNLKPLADELIKIYGENSVKNISLPWHNNSEIPSFDEGSFIEHISEEISQYKKQNRKVIIIGHSTGGNLTLACIRDKGLLPDYLILVAVPFRIDPGALERWNEHRTGEARVPFTDVARMISLINRTCKYDYFSGEFHSLIINGEDDKLVLPSDACEWKKKFPYNKARVIFAPHVDHDVFNSSNSNLIIDVILRAIADVKDDYKDNLSEHITVEPEIQEFIIASPFSKRHIAGCPGGKRISNSHNELGPVPETEPVFANIEITTHCNFKCKFCARSRTWKGGVNMHRDNFRRILDLLPHAYRITLVGLGEPLLHPEIVDFVETAVSLKRRVGLVTNASLLDSSISKELISAGLHSIAFSLDTVTQDAASLVREGTDINKVLENIKNFIKTADAARTMAKAVFTALSTENISYFNDLINIISTLGIDVMMLTDLNFKENVNKTIWKNVDDKIVKSIRNTIKQAFLKKLPILSVHALEEFGLRSRYRDFLLLPPDQLYHRSKKRKYCFSPWQTVPVDVEGNITMCDCQPENRVGNILADPFNEIWLGEKMTDYRHRMLSNNPPESCKICPRF